MANKYIIHGAVLCGDGTSPNEATVAGGVGAWNDINIFEGTAPPFGTLAAGDTVYIRSKDALGNAITRTLTASVVIGSASATVSAPITWVIDHGAIWPGVIGVITYQCPSTYVVTCRNYNKYISNELGDLIIIEQNTAPNYKDYFGSVSSVHLKNIVVDATAAASGSGNKFGTYNGNSVLEGVKIRCGVVAEVCFKSGAYSTTLFIGVNVEYTKTTNVPVFSASGSGANIYVYGGSLTGAGAATAGAIVSTAQGSVVRLFGFRYPVTAKLAAVQYLPYVENDITSTGSDGLVGATIIKAWGMADARTDAYYPVLSATLPDSTTRWSWWIYPANADSSKRLHLPICKAYTGAEESKTITLELLVSDNFAAIDKASLWATLVYEDATGLKTLSTFNPAGGALDASTANWSATSYGATSYTKKKFSITTPTAIKPNSLITVVLNGTAKASSSLDTLIVCPDFSLV